MKVINVRKQDNRLFRVEVQPPIGKGNVKVIRDVTQEELDEVVEAERLFRTKLIAHLKEVRRVLIEECGHSPESFPPIVE